MTVSASSSELSESSKFSSTSSIALAPVLGSPSMLVSTRSFRSRSHELEESYLRVMSPRDDDQMPIPIVTSPHSLLQAIKKGNSPYPMTTSLTTTAVLPTTTTSPPKAVSLFELYRYATSWDKWLVGIGCAMAIINGCMYPTMAILFGQAINHFHPVNMSIIQQVALAYLGISIALFISDFVSTVCLTISCERQTKRMQCQVFRHLLRQDMAWYDQHKDVLALTSKLSADTARIKDGMGLKLGELLRYTAQFFMGYAIGFYHNWGVALVMSCVMPFMVFCLSWLIKTMRQQTISYHKRYAQAGAIAEETLGSIRTVAAFHGQQQAIDKYKAKAQEAEEENIRMDRVVAMVLGIFFGTIWFSYASGLWYGAKLVSDGDLDPGTVFSAFYGILIGTISLAQISPNLSAVVAAKAVAGGLFALLQTRPAIDATSRDGFVPLSRCRAEIEFVNVSFAYPARPRDQILNNLSLRIPAGSSVAFVGSSGSGKSTIVSLLERFYDPKSGQILLDGVALTRYRVSWLRSQIGYVAQEPVLFATSIFDNIVAGASLEDASMTLVRMQVEHAAKLAKIHDFVMTLPDNYNTRVGAKGVALSGGQKQRIAIARALVRCPKILILDEATSALDTASESAFQQAMDAWVKEMRLTNIVIAHRLSTIRNAETIFVLQKGQLVEHGTHEQLMAKSSGVYRQLVESQLEASTCAPQCQMDERVVETSLSRTRDSESEFSVETSNSKADRVVDQSRTSRLRGLDEELLERVHEEEDEDTEDERRTNGLLKSFRLRRSMKHRMSQMTESRGSMLSLILHGMDPSKPPPEAEFLQEFALSRLMAMNRPEQSYFFIGMVAAAINGLTFPASAVLLSSIASCMVNKYSLYQSTHNDAYLDQLYHEVLKYAAIYVGGAIGLIIVNFLQAYCFRFMAEKLVTRLRVMHLRALCRQPMSFYDQIEVTSGTGSLSTDLVTCAQQVTAICGDSQGRICQATFTFLAAMLISFLMGSWLLSLIMSVAFPILILANVIRSKHLKGMLNTRPKPAQKPTSPRTKCCCGCRGASEDEENEERVQDVPEDDEDPVSKAGAIASQSLQQIRTIASCGLEQAMGDQYYAHLFASDAQDLKSAQIGGLALGFSSFATFAVYALVFWCGAIFIQRGEITFQEMIRSLMAIIMSSAGIGQAASYLGDMEAAKRACRKIFELNDSYTAMDPFSQEGFLPRPAPAVALLSTRDEDEEEEEEKKEQDRDEEETPSGLVEFVEVEFSYPTRHQIKILQDLNLRIEAGQRVAICGPSGSGKSTLFGLLERFYDPDRGMITIDGIPLQSMNLRALREMIGLIGQEPVLFTGTILENIVYGSNLAMTGSGTAANTYEKESDTQVTEQPADKQTPFQKRVEQVAKIANAHGFITSFPDGYATQVGAKGGQLSGGQKQRIAIARALFKDPKLLLLDEATSALDAESERLVQQALDQTIQSKKRTTIVIAHRLSTIRSADKICVLQQGQIVEEGHHQELLALGGVYSRLVASYQTSNSANQPSGP